MPRRPRLEVPFGLFHVAQRATDHEVLFAGFDDRFVFEYLLGVTLRRYGWRLEASCQMTTHYHLVVQTPEPTLARGMQYLNGRLVRAFNDRHVRRGTLVHGRYFSRLIEDEPGYERALNYVALNPVKAGLCVRPDEWPWSTFASERARAFRDQAWR